MLIVDRNKLSRMKITISISWYNSRNCFHPRNINNSGGNFSNLNQLSKRINCIRWFSMIWFDLIKYNIIGDYQ